MASVFFVLLVWRMQRNAAERIAWDIERAMDREASTAVISRLRGTIDALRERLKQE
jgi:hypothetical protein